MREILFKAKSIHNGAWVEGYFAKVKWHLGENELNVIIPTENCFYYGTGCWYEIDINTLCQYTGLTDKNGNKIWENDILTFEVLNECVVRYGETEEGYHVGFYADWANKGAYLREDLGFWVHEREVEVTGNIFDET